MPLPQSTRARRFPGARVGSFNQRSQVVRAELATDPLNPPRSAGFDRFNLKVTPSLSDGTYAGILRGKASESADLSRGAAKSVSGTQFQRHWPAPKPKSPPPAALRETFGSRDNAAILRHRRWLIAKPSASPGKPSWRRSTG